MELRIDPLEGIPHHKDLLEQLRGDPDSLKRLRKEVELLLVEQLIDHEVEPDARGLTRHDFDEKMSTLEQERRQTSRKHVNFAEIRAVSKQANPTPRSNIR